MPHLFDTTSAALAFQTSISVPLVIIIFSIFLSDYFGWPKAITAARRRRLFDLGSIGTAQRVIFDPERRASLAEEKFQVLIQLGSVPVYVSFAGNAYQIPLRTNKSQKQFINFFYNSWIET